MGSLNLSGLFGVFFIQALSHCSFHVQRVLLLVDHLIRFILLTLEVVGAQGIGLVLQLLVLGTLRKVP